MSIDQLQHLPSHVQGWIRDVRNDPAVNEGLCGFENLRSYQLEAVLAAAARVRKTLAPLLIVLPTGAGKSWVISALASVVLSMVTAISGKRKKVLILAPSKELVSQNHAKMIEAGYQATIYSAGLNSRDASGDIVFGSRQTITNVMDEFRDKDYEFSTVFVDEAHSLPEQTRSIIEGLRTTNPNLRVIGLTATPYALGKGYIFAQDKFKGLPKLREIHTKDPYFAEKVYDKCPHELIEEGYLCPPILGDISEAYNTSALERAQNGRFTQESSSKVFVDGQSSLTKKIVKEIKRKAKNRNGVMLFAQNRSHAQMILSFLPAKQSGLVDSKTKPKDRDDLIKRFKARKLKYMVTVGALATGFDAPNVDLIGVLRATESHSLFQQIIGRGLRLCPEIGKKDCLVLDYAQNIPPDGDLFTPTIQLGVPREAPDIPLLDVRCPACGGENQFRKARWPSDTKITDTGFLWSHAQNRLLLSSDQKPVAGHLGTQCGHLIDAGDNKLKRCSYTWGAVICPRCQRRNSHRTDFCKACEAPLSKRARLLTLSTSRDATYAQRLVKVVSYSSRWLVAGRSKSGHPNIRLTFNVKEPPYLVPAEPQRKGRKASEEESDLDEWLLPGFEIVRPEPFELTAWINPTINNSSAKASWEAFKAYAQDQQVGNGSWDQYTDINALLYTLTNPRGDLSFNPPGYLVYTQKKIDESRTFFNLVSFYKEHPEHVKINESLTRDEV
ncbi:MAG: ATP-dependent helicase [Oleiphilus sp.]|nr:MAG: ATP-dependent helicase [Oleiphilus sp.]